MSLPALALALFVTGFQEPATPRLRPERARLPAAPFALPMQLRGPSPVVEVRVNGQGPFRFLLDTGAKGAARVDRSLVERLGLAVTGEALGGDPTGRPEARMQTVELDSLELGPARFEGVPALSRDYNLGAPDLPPIDGVLGWHLFAGLALTLDFPGRELRVDPAPYQPPAGARTCALTSSADEVPSVHVRIGGIELEDVVLDTGKMGGLGVPSDVLAKLQLLAEPTIVGRGRTVTGEFEVLRARVAGSLELCGVERVEPWVDSVPAMPRAVLGAGALAELVVTLDPDAGLVWLRDAATERALMRAEHSPRRTELERRVELPLERVGGRPTLELFANGRGPFRFLLDTGSPGCVVSEALAETLELARGERVPIGAPGGPRTETAQAGALDELLLGDAVFTGVPVLVTDLGGFLGGGRGPDGLVGIGLFADCLATLELARDALVLEPGALAEPDGETVLAIEWEEGGRGLPGFALTVGELKLHAHLDTGAPMGIGLPLALKGELPLAGEPRRIGSARTISGQSEILSAPLAEPPRLGALALDAKDAYFFGQLESVNLGSAAALHFVVTYDLAHDRVRFAPAG